MLLLMGNPLATKPGAQLWYSIGQPHGVIARRSAGFDVTDFPPGQDDTQVFLTWELPIEDANLGHALRIAFDIEPSPALLLGDEQVWRNGARAVVCPDSGRWCRAS